MDNTISSVASVVISQERTTRPRMAKVHLRKPDQDTWRADIGATVKRARLMLGWTLKEFAVAVDRDPRQCAKWETGEDRPQLDAIFAVKELRAVFVIAVAALVKDEIAITTTMTIAR